MPLAIAQTALAVLGIPRGPVHAPVHGGPIYLDSYGSCSSLWCATKCRARQIGAGQDPDLRCGTHSGGDQRNKLASTGCLWGSPAYRIRLGGGQRFDTICEQPAPEEMLPGLERRR